MNEALTNTKSASRLFCIKRTKFLLMLIQNMCTTKRAESCSEIYQKNFLSRLNLSPSGINNSKEVRYVNLGHVKA